ncbi:hypothetical protein CCO03_06850 [Comamonas serinivorans]|uniref:Uncharacterized protein n=2 Tax=Comamonas serinivorans TaxID=1082851 RepID=A0A1Y0EM00_9BURK|nr:hypothetical protein CCO03_06850 [Comamonas serinivorans]
MNVVTAFSFRVLLVASCVLGVLSGCLDFFMPELVPAALHADRVAIEASRADSYTLPMGAVALLALGGVLIAIYGLYTFRRWAPWLNLAMTGVGLVLTVAVGPGVQSGWALALLMLSSYLWGALVLASFGGVYRAQFQGQKH